MNGRSAAFIAILGLAGAAYGSVKDGFVSGVVDVKNARTFRLVANELGSTFFSSDTLSIDISGGPIDVNAVERSDESCFLAWCDRRTWIDHNWQKATEWPVEFSLVDETGNAIFIQTPLVSKDGKLTIPIPPQGVAGFTRKLQLLARVVDAAPPIDANRSQGQFKITISVDTATRANAFTGYLMGPESPSPRTKDLKQWMVYDPFLIEQNRSSLAHILVEYAKRFSALDEVTASEHKGLLEYASEIDPLSVEPAFAMADAFLASGKGADAETVLIDEIKKLQAFPDAKTNRSVQLNLARAFVKLGQAIESARGYAESDDIGNIVAQYSKALEIAPKIRAPALELTARSGRAFANRARNTLPGLEAAATDFRAARDSSPKTFFGFPLSVSPDDQTLLAMDGRLRQAIVLRPIDDPGSEGRLIELPGESVRALGISPNGKVLALSGNALGWLDLKEEKPRFSGQVTLAASPMFVETNDTNGKASFLTLIDGGRALPTLFTESLSQRRLSIDGQPTDFVVLARNANRYVVTALAQPPVAELREIDVGGDRTIARVSLPSMLPMLVRVSADGKKFAMLLVGFDAEKRAVRRLIVWDENGSSIEVASTRAPGANMPLPDSTVNSFDFDPNGTQILAIQMGGGIVVLDLKESAVPTTLSVATGAEMPAGKTASRYVWTDSHSLVITLRDADGVWLVEWPAKQVKLLAQSGASDSTLAGIWKDGRGRYYFVLHRVMPISIFTLKTDDAGELGRGTIDRKSPVSIQVISSGRFVCFDDDSQRLVLKDLKTGEERTIASSERDNLNRRILPRCLPGKSMNEWFLVWTSEEGEPQSIRSYRGFDPLNGKLDLPQIPDDIVAMETAAIADAKAGAESISPPFFHVGNSYDSRQILYLPTGFPEFAYARLPFATRKGDPKEPPVWISLPYVWLTQSPDSLHRVRLPADAIPLALWENPIGTVIYARAGKVYVKDLLSDTTGTLLFDGPAVAPTVGAPPPFIYYRVSSDQKRARFAETTMQQTMKLDTVQRIFAIDGDNSRPVPCSKCVSKGLDWNALTGTKPGSATQFLPNGLFTAIGGDANLQYIPSYDIGEAAIHDVGTNVEVASLPLRLVFWLGDGRAFVSTGANQFSFIRY